MISNYELNKMKSFLKASLGVAIRFDGLDRSNFYFPRQDIEELIQEIEDLRSVNKQLQEENKYLNSMVKKND